MFCASYSSGGLLPLLFITLRQQRRNLRSLTLLFQRHEGQVRPARELTPARERLLGKHRHFDFQRRREHRRDACLQHDEIADLDRIEKLEAVDRRRHDQFVRVTERGDRGGDIDEVHDGAAEHESHRVCVVRQHDLDHLGGGR